MYIYATGTHVHVVRQLVVAYVYSVEPEIHETGTGIERQSDDASEFRGQGIADEGLVSRISQQIPFLRIGAFFAEQAYFLRELEAVGLFVHMYPCRVTASTHLDAIPAERIASIDKCEGCIRINVMARDAVAVQRLHVEGRQTGELPLRAKAECEGSKKQQDEPPLFCVYR